MTSGGEKIIGNEDNKEKGGRKKGRRLKNEGENGDPEKISAKSNI